ncbi:PP2C family protein-serine/threonine phosphatase [Pedobacter sp. SYSU D00535]|uniref:PP2C family protein-serine/threonine phosphatase n=1 Tax=Pedobacter sp. SYSU D00535 TaxID=2810308 RepID=UPI001F6242A4|nr:PP2C family protein-serine/threonine phosphatase [Pedobacter sp. SYSU D00535]
MEPIKSGHKEPDENDLIQLLLKRQAELNALLEVTLAINKNSASSVLFEMLEVVLRVNLNVGKMRLLVKEGDQFYCASKYGGDNENVKSLLQACPHLVSIKTITSLNSHVDELLNKYDYFVPVRHKSNTLAFVLIGDFHTRPELLSHELNFIQTLINIIIVALENKKLFKERVQRERMQRDMELASEVQSMLVPLKLPQSDTFEVAATYLPHQNIGGDYFDFIRLDKNEFLWCIADVSGKGVSAALLMANLQASLRAWASVEHNLDKIIRKLNDLVTSNTKGERFITLFLGRYNELTREMEFVNAGHNSPILISGGDVRYLKEGTTMLGIFDELPFVNTGKLVLKKDSLVFNYTDGLIESPDEEVFILEDELVHYLKLHKPLCAQEINKNILADIQSHYKAKMNSDDITLLTLKVH